MNDHEAIQMMRRCKDEILILRRINAELAPKADAYDALRQVLNMIPQKSQGFAEDLAWRLDKEIEAANLRIADSELVAEKPNA